MGGFAKHVTDELHTQYMAAYGKGLSEELTREFDTKMDQRLQELREALALAQATACDALKTRARREELSVIEDILTVKCPRCSQAILDFTGCFALTCNRCEAGICAWCLADCGKNSHPHVKVCPKNKHRHGTYYGTVEMFNKARQKERKERLTQYLCELAPELQAPVRDRIRPHLRDLGLESVLQKIQ
jgi:hypothetical protein